MNKIDEIDEHSERIREILEKQPNVFLRAGISVIFMVMTAALFVTWLIKYPDIIQAQAVVTTKLPPQKEYAKSSGKLDVILVSDNALVKTNQPLAVLSNSADCRDVFKLKATMDTTIISNEGFTFPFDQLPALTLGDIEPQFALFENSYVQYQLNKKLQPFSNELLANRFSLAQSQRQLNNLQLQKLINQSELSLQELNLNRNKDLLNKKVIPPQDFESVQLAYTQAKRSYQNYESSIAQMEENVSYARKVSKTTVISRIKEEKTLVKNLLQNFIQLKKVIRDWERNYVFQSSIEGRVIFLNAQSVNQTVNQGELLFSIIPTQNSSFAAKLKSPALNSGKIKVGQKVNIKLDNYPSSEFGILEGIVSNVSSIPDEKGLYIVGVTLPKDLITSYHKRIDFKQEMTGVGEIITEDLRLLERIFFQIKNIFK